MSIEKQRKAVGSLDELVGVCGVINDGDLVINVCNILDCLVGQTINVSHIKVEFRRQTGREISSALALDVIENGYMPYEIDWDNGYVVGPRFTSVPEVFRLFQFKGQKRPGRSLVISAEKADEFARLNPWNAETKTGWRRDRLEIVQTIHSNISE